MGFFNDLFGGGSDYLKGSANAANQLTGQLQGEGKDLFSQGQNIQGQLLPFFSNMMKNPQGLGPTTMSQIMTSAGQATAGGEGAARQRAMDLASRTGNTAAIPGIIGGASKTGMVEQADTSRDLGVKNAMMKMQQQQEGASGLSGLFGKDIGSSLDASKAATSADELANKIAQQKQQAAQSGLKSMFGGIQGIGDMLSGILPGGAGGAAGGIGTLASLFV